MPRRRFENRAEFVEYHLYQSWVAAHSVEKGTVFRNTRGYNVAVMKDHNDSNVWVFSIRRIGEQSGGFGREKFRTELEAKRAALEELAEILGIPA